MLDLARGAAGPAVAGSPAAGAAHDMSLGSMDAGDVLDAPARTAYRRRLVRLRAELEEAQARPDPDRVAALEAESAFLTRELARATGLGGRVRRASSVAERARLSVTRAIRGALDKIEEGHPSLGRHLRRYVKTGTFCGYSPEPASIIPWEF